MNFVQQKNKAINNLLLAALIATPIVLLVLVLFSPGNLINDENNFTYNIPLLAKYGLSARFLNELHNQSPGPLYQLIYYPLECIGIKPIREYRLVNLFFLFGIVYLLFRLMKQESMENSFMKSLLIFVIPVTWVTGGLALTEIPTIFFVLSSLIVFKTALTRSKFRLFPLSVSGLLLGLSIIGRMQFIVVFPMAVYVLIKLKDIDFKSIAAFCICTLLFPVCLVYVWKGLVPPELQSAQSGMNFMYLLFSFGFASFFLLLLYPAWFKIPKAALYLKILSALLVVFFLLNIKFFNMRFMPMQTLGRVLPASIRPLYEEYFSLLFPCIMLCVTFLYLIALYYQLSNNMDSTWNIFLLVSATLLIVTALKSSAQFSSRYPFQAVPFLLLYCAKDIKPSLSLFVRASIGVLIGVVSLMLFYHQ